MCNKIQWILFFYLQKNNFQLQINQETHIQYDDLINENYAVS